MNALNLILAVVLVLVVYGGACALLYFKVLKPTWAWFGLCNDLEKEIRQNHDYESQMKRLLELKEKSWHRSTSERIRQLALMMEVKYNVEILKR